MFCPSCGHDNLQNAAHCAACGTSLAGDAVPPPPGPDWGTRPGYGPAGGHDEPRPDNYLVWAILSTALCCLPFGVVSVIFAAQVDTKYQLRDYAGAREASEKARMWALVSLGAWAVVVGGYLLLVLIAIVAGNGA